MSNHKNCSELPLTNGMGLDRAPLNFSFSKFPHWRRDPLLCGACGYPIFKCCFLERESCFCNGGFPQKRMNIEHPDCLLFNSRYMAEITVAGIEGITSIHLGGIGIISMPSTHLQQLHCHRRFYVPIKVPTIMKHWGEVGANGQVTWCQQNTRQYIELSTATTLIHYMWGGLEWSGCLIFRGAATGHQLRKQESALSIQCSAKHKDNTMLERDTASHPDQYNAGIEEESRALRMRWRLRFNLSLAESLASSSTWLISHRYPSHYLKWNPGMCLAFIRVL